MTNKQKGIIARVLWTVIIGLAGLYACNPEGLIL